MSDVTRQRQNLKVLSQESQLYTERNEKAWMGFIEEVLYLGFPGGSDGKESACNTGDPGSIPGSGRSPEEGNGNPHPFFPGEFHRQRSLVGYSLWVAELHMTEQISDRQTKDGDGHQENQS